MPDAYNEDMPWVNLTPQEVEELRTKKHELTEYGKQRIKEMTDKENEVLKIAKDAMNTYDKAFKELARIERSERILKRYNKFYNTECSALTHGTPITPEHQQAMALECMVNALRCENLNHEFDTIPTEDINDLITSLYDQGRASLERFQQSLKPKE